MGFLSWADVDVNQDSGSNNPIGWHNLGMESLAMFVSIMLLTILLIAGAAVTLSVLSWSGKLHKAFGYSAFGVLAAITALSFTVNERLGIMPLIPLIITAFFAFTSKKQK